MRKCNLATGIVNQGSARHNYMVSSFATNEGSELENRGRFYLQEDYN